MAVTIIRAVSLFHCLMFCRLVWYGMLPCALPRMLNRNPCEQLEGDDSGTDKIRILIKEKGGKRKCCKQNI
ncbi:hypothetical protein ARMGADRAFT_1010859 [Armillaria gallica]|uniref:Uncharacterized protein n=1 Tax=Armillaria gallica TaxID=47427 RepID=A0A2H3DQ13_ARMGA|nr:hypothetical protein ARMGADRAFT_1010859 [Armillaria gallica]